MLHCPAPGRRQREVDGLEEGTELVKGERKLLGRNPSPFTFASVFLTEHTRKFIVLHNRA
jgi:hypothetical protein